MPFTKVSLKKVPKADLVKIERKQQEQHSTITLLELKPEQLKI